MTNTNALEKHHLAQLQNSAISPEVIAERGYRSITSKAELANLGFSASQQRVPGLLIPQYGVDGKLSGYQYRPDKPRTNKKGKTIKYENPIGSRIRLDCPPRCQSMLRDPTIPLWSTEGSKKADALVSKRACAISLTGVWGFKGKNDAGGITFLDDWDYIALKGRKVYLAFDSDIIDKSEVRKALERLAQHLENKGAKVFIVRLPGGNGAKVGIDDYLAEGYTLDDVVALAEPYEPEAEELTIRRPYLYHNGKLCLQVKMFTGKMAFAYLDGDKVKFTEQLSLGNGRTVVPHPLPKGEDGVELELVGMPDEGVSTVPLLTPAELLARIKAHISKYVDLASLDLDLCCYYALFTWFFIKVNTLGYLRFIADTGKGKTRVQKVTGDICFYPFRTSGASSFSGIARTGQRWHGTMVMDEFDLAGEIEHQIIKYLNLGFEQGQYYVLSDKQNPRFQQYFDPFMPKIIAMRKPFGDNATEGRLLSITTYETTNLDIPILLPCEYSSEVSTLRNYLARFVMEHWDKVDGSKMSTFQHLLIEPRLKQLAMPLSIIFQLWPDGEGQFEEYLLARQKELRRERSMSWEGMLFNLVYAIAVGDIDLKDSYAEYYSKEGDIEAITPTMVSRQLNSKPKSVTQGLTSIGFGVESRRLPSNNKKPRLYAVSDSRKWREMVSRYYYSENEDDVPQEAPEVLRSLRYVVFPYTSHLSHPSPKPIIGVGAQESGTLGTLGTVRETRNKKNDDTKLADPPDYPCHICGCSDYWLTDWNEWLCSHCHPKSGGES